MLFQARASCKIRHITNSKQNNSTYKKKNKQLSLSQMTNFRLFQTKEFADNNFKFDKNDTKFSKRVENSNFYFSHSVFKRLVLQTRKNQGLFGKGLKHLSVNNSKKHGGKKTAVQDLDVIKYIYS